MKDKKFNIGMHRDILRLSIPSILSNITVPLLGLCDTAISGHLGSASYLSAIAVGTLMLNVMTWLCGFLRMGSTGMVAQAYGAGDDARQAAVLSTSLLVAFVLGIACVVMQDVLLRVFIFFISPEEDACGMASMYFRICVWGMPATLMTMALTGWFIGRQCTVWPMVIAIASNIVNICASFLLAFPVGFGFEGIAYGTLSANWTGFILALVLARRSSKGGQLLLPLYGALKEVRLRRFFSVNGDLFLRSACVMAVSTGVTAFGSRLGVLAANAVMMQFFTLFSFFMDGFAFTAEALCGRYKGAGDVRMLRESIRALMSWSVVIALIFMLLYGMGWRVAVDLLTDVESVRQQVADCHAVLLFLPVVSFAAFIFDGFYIGMTCTRRMLVVTLMASAAFFGVAATIKESGVDGNMYLWIAFLTYLFVRGVGLGVQLPYLIRIEQMKTQNK